VAVLRHLYRTYGSSVLRFVIASHAQRISHRATMIATVTSNLTIVGDPSPVTWPNHSKALCMLYSNPFRGSVGTCLLQHGTSCRAQEPRQGDDTDYSHFRRLKYMSIPPPMASMTPRTAK